MSFAVDPLSLLPPPLPLPSLPVGVVFSFFLFPRNARGPCIARSLPPLVASLHSLLCFVSFFLFHALASSRSPLASPTIPKPLLLTYCHCSLSSSSPILFFWPIATAPSLPPPQSSSSGLLPLLPLFLFLPIPYCPP